MIEIISKQGLGKLGLAAISAKLHLLALYNENTCCRTIVQPLPSPGIYYYKFVIDGVWMHDQVNANIKRLSLPWPRGHGIKLGI